MLGFFRKNADANAGTDAPLISVNTHADNTSSPASFDEAIALAGELLMFEFSDAEITHHARALADGPIPFSTEELALCTALHFFRQAENHDKLYNAQLFARMTMMSWQEQGQVSQLIAQCFENTIYTRFRPDEAA